MTETSETGTAALGGELVGGRYRLQEILGSGGMGRVWLAEDELLRRPVAVKEMLGPAADRVDIQLRTVREARAAARLDHPGVVKVFDVVWLSDRAWIVMEYVRSRSLQIAVQADGPFDHRAAARIGLRVLGALRAAHAARVLHLDVKPHNVLLAEDGRVVLGDFGLAVTADPDGGPEPVLMGSPYYVAPERIKLGGRPSPATDLWSLGATLYAATEGRPPFVRATTAASLSAVLHDEPDPAKRPGPLTPVLLDLLAKKRDDRPGAADLERRLREVAEGGVPRPRRSPGVAARGTATVTPVGSVSRGPSVPPASAASSAPAASSGSAASSASAASIPAGPAGSVPPAPAASDFLAPAGVEPELLPAMGVSEELPRGRKKRYVLVGAAVVLVAAVGAAIGLDDQRSGAPAAPQPSVAAATSGASGAAVAPAVVSACGAGVEATAVTPAKTRVPAGLPAGWVWFRDPTGFTLALPAGWQRSMSGTVVCFEGPTAGAAFMVDSAALVTRKPLEYFQSQEKSAKLPGYQRISMDNLLLRRGGADWEYTWQPDSDTTQHVRRVLLAVTDSRSYLLKWTTSDAAWSRNVKLEQQLVTLFDSAS
jgi:serine/threonine protein kinase